MKKLLRLSLAAMALAVTACTTAFGADVGTISAVSIGDTEIEPLTKYVIDDSGNVTKAANQDDENYNVYYDEDTKILDLKNANLKKSLYVYCGTTIKLEGENSIKSTTGIQTFEAGDDNSLTVKGKGSVEILTDTEGINNIYGDIIIEDAGVRITNESSSPIYSTNGGITIKGNAEVTINSGNGGISCSDTLAIKDNAKVTVERNAVTALSSDNKIIVSDNADVHVEASSIAISGGKGIEILGEAFVEATGSMALNSFGGDIIIEGTAIVEGMGNQNAAVSVGRVSTSSGSITVTGTLNVYGAYAGIGATGAGDVLIDGGNVTIEDVPFGIITGMGLSGDINGGNITICNEGELKVTGSAMGIYPQANSILTVDNSEVDIEAASWGIFCPGIVFKDSVITCDTKGKAIGAAKDIDYEYEAAYKFLAGESSDTAVLIKSEEQKDHLQDKYVKIEPAKLYTVNVLDSYADDSGEGSYTAGERVTIKAGKRDGYRFIKWNADVALDDEYSNEASFEMPEEDVTVAAEWEKDKTASSGGGSSHSLSEKKGGNDKNEEKPIIGETEESIFSDVSISDPNYKAIKEAYEKGYMEGIGNGLFAPNGYLTRGMAAKIIWNMAKEPKPNGVAPFLDVTSDAWYAEAVAWCYEKGIAVGYDEMTFGPDDYITQEQFTIMLTKLYAETAKPYTGFSPLATRGWVAYKIYE